MFLRLRAEVDALVEYTEPFNSRIFRKANQLDEQSHRRFIEVRKKYEALAFFTLMIYGGDPGNIKERFELPLRESIQNSKFSSRTDLPEDLLDAASLRDFLDVICSHACEGIATFDRPFGGRA